MKNETLNIHAIKTGNCLSRSGQSNLIFIYQNPLLMTHPQYKENVIQMAWLVAKALLTAYCQESLVIWKQKVIQI